MALIRETTRLAPSHLTASYSLALGSLCVERSVHRLSCGNVADLAKRGHLDDHNINMDKSILNRLPAELRLQIFEHVYPPGDIDVIFVWGRRTPFTTRWPRPGNSHLALLSTCHQVRSEATPVLLAHTRLVVRTVILDRNTKLASISNAKWCVMRLAAFHVYYPRKCS